MNESVNRQTQEQISLKELILKIQEGFGYLWRQKKIVLLGGILGGLLGLAYAFIKKPVYTATTTFVLESGDKAGGLGAYAGLASMVGIDLGAGGNGGIFQGDNILELYKSRTMIEKALLSPVSIDGKKKLLIERYISYNNLRKKWDKKEATRNVTFNFEPHRVKDSLLTEIVEDINKNILLVSKPDKKLSIIKVEANSKDEQFSLLFNERIVEMVNDFYVETKTKKSQENIAILQHQTDSVRAMMEGAIYKSVQVADATPNLNPTRQVLRAPAMRSQANAEANKAVYGELVKNLELAKITARKDAPLIQVIDKPRYPLKNDKIGKALGIVVGGGLFGFLTVCYLIIRLLFKHI